MGKRALPGVFAENFAFGNIANGAGGKSGMVCAG
jgi:hypothetical protein